MCTRACLFVVVGQGDAQPITGSVSRPAEEAGMILQYGADRRTEASQSHQLPRKMERTTTTMVPIQTDVSDRLSGLVAVGTVRDVSTLDSGC